MLSFRCPSHCSLCYQLYTRYYPTFIFINKLYQCGPSPASYIPRPGASLRRLLQSQHQQLIRLGVRMKPTVVLSKIKSSYGKHNAQIKAPGVKLEMSESLIPNTQLAQTNQISDHNHVALGHPDRKHKPFISNYRARILRVPRGYGGR